MIISHFRHSGKKGFTLAEMMIVVAIIGILMSFGLLPYGTYMEQARLSNNVDHIAQEWILAHKEVRNGIEIESGKHATIILEFNEKEQKINKYLYAGVFNKDGKITNLPDFVDEANNTNANEANNTKKTISLERNIKFFGSNFTDNNEKFYYVILPPYAEGKFYKENLVEDLSNTPNQETIMIGYADAKDENSTRLKKILLRAYLQ